MLLQSEDQRRQMESEKQRTYKELERIEVLKRAKIHEEEQRLESLRV